MRDENEAPHTDDADTSRRRDEVIRRMLATPPQPKKPKKPSA